MIPHPYVYEKLIATRHAEIQHNMQQAQVKQRRSFIRLTIGSFGRLLIVLGSNMQHTGQQNESGLPSF